MRSPRPHPIVFVLTSFDAGGTERQMVELIRRLDAAMFRPYVACFHRRGVLLERAAERTVSIAEFPLHGFRRVSAGRQLASFARWCRYVKADIVHTCDLYANIFGLPGAALAGVPVRIGNRRELVTPDKRPAQFLCQRLAYRAAHLIVANSEAAGAQLRREGVDPRRIQVIPNGIDMAAFRADAPGPRDVRRLVAVANLRPEKGHGVLIDALARIVVRHPAAELHLAGDGPARDALAAHVRRQGLEGHVHFLGYREDIPALLAAADLFVLPSRSEASPNAVMEAMAAGLPVVATDVGGVPELVAHGRTGLLVAPDNAEVLASSLLQLMERPGFARALGCAARAHIEARYSFDRMVASFERAYLAEIETRHPVHQPAGRLAAS